MISAYPESANTCALDRTIKHLKTLTWGTGVKEGEGRQLTRLWLAGV